MGEFIRVAESTRNGRNAHLFLDSAFPFVVF